MIYSKEQDEPLMCMKSPGGPGDSSVVFERLERNLGNIRGRKFYGLFREIDGEEEYNCCVKMEPGDDPDRIGVVKMSFPAGKYDRELLRDWANKWDRKNIEGLREMIGSMLSRNGENVDAERYSIEYYRSQRELYFFLPIK